MSTATFKSRKGRPPKYPWERWTNGRTHRLFKGSSEQREAEPLKYFEADLISFRTMVHRKARDLGAHIGAYTNINEADQSVTIRFYDRNEA